jgi:hypothetical protein
MSGRFFKRRFFYAPTSTRLGNVNKFSAQESSAFSITYAVGASLLS